MYIDHLFYLSLDHGLCELSLLVILAGIKGQKLLVF
jgi:hypothetical protein